MLKEEKKYCENLLNEMKQKILKRKESKTVAKILEAKKFKRNEANRS